MMKPLKNLLTILLILLPLSAYAWGVVATSGGVAAASGGCTENCGDYIICQNFEGTGYDNSESWSETGSPNEDYATSPCPLRGSQSLLCTAGTSTLRDLTTYTGEVWVHVIFRYNQSTTGLDTVLALEGYGASNVLSLSLNSDNELWLLGASGSMKGHATTAPDTTYHLWIHYAMGSASNSAGQLYIGTTTTRPESASVSFSDGATDTHGVRKVNLTCPNMSGLETYYDQILMDDSAFTTVCD